MRKKNKCVIWTRVSTAKQEKNGGSLDYQRQLCEQYAREHENDPATWNAFRRRITKVYRQIAYGNVVEEQEEDE